MHPADTSKKVMNFFKRINGDREFSGEISEDKQRKAFVIRMISSFRQLLPERNFEMVSSQRVTVFLVPSYKGMPLHNVRQSLRVIVRGLEAEVAYHICDDVKRNGQLSNQQLLLVQSGASRIFHQRTDLLETHNVTAEELLEPLLALIQTIKESRKQVITS
jgi:hypothetical protein